MDLSLQLAANGPLGVYLLLIGALNTHLNIEFMVARTEEKMVSDYLIFGSL